MHDAVKYSVPEHSVFSDKYFSLSPSLTIYFYKNFKAVFVGELVSLPMNHICRPLWLQHWILGMEVPLECLCSLVAFCSLIPCRIKKSYLYNFGNITCCQFDHLARPYVPSVRCQVQLACDSQETEVTCHCFQLLLLSRLLGLQGCDDRGLPQVCGMQMKG